MCGFSKTKLRNKTAYMYFGYYGGEFSLGDDEYKQGDKVDSKIKMINCLTKYKKQELIKLFLDFVDNSDEG